MEQGREKTLKRLARIEGQVRGVTKMIESERYCIDVLQQLGAIRAALGKVEDAVLSDHASTCVERAIASGDPADQREKFNELVDLISKTKR
ncbi:MAG: metal-sensitive transcriptional regulator [Pseudomonadota bacterium]